MQISVRVTLSILLTAFFIAAVPSYCTAKSATDTYTSGCLARAHADLKRNSFRSGLRNCDDAIKADPKCAEAYLLKGFALRGLEDYKGSATALKTGLRLLPNYGKGYKPYPGAADDTAYDTLVTSQMAAGDTDGAMQSITKLIPLASNAHNLYENRSTIYLNQNKYDLALADLNKAIALKPQEIHHYENRARVYSQLKKHKEAIADLTRAIDKMTILDPIILRRRGDEYKAIGDMKHAQKDYDSAGEDDFQL